MKIQSIFLHPYEIPLTTGQKRSGVLINIMGENEESGWGDIAPLPNGSRETLEEGLSQLDQKKEEIIGIHWMPHSCLKELEKLSLLPSVSFGLESALLAILEPLSSYSVAASALLMGSPEQILHQAKLRHAEGYASAKLKISNLSFEDAAGLIHKLRDTFRLRIDVNRAWTTEESLRFFSQFPQNAFDYVEEPFQNPHDLALFSHPLAVDESFPQDLSLAQLEWLPKLKALIYKPTIQGGMVGCMHLDEWTRRRGIELVLSSSFESDVGLGCIASMAHRISLKSPIGIGTYHFLTHPIMHHGASEIA